MTADARFGDAAAGFSQLRPNLMRVAYRMLGSVAGAEDIVQEAFIRWMRADRSDVREPEAFLRRTHGHTDLPRPAEIGATDAGDLYWSPASRSRRGRGRCAS